MSDATKDLVVVTPTNLDALANRILYLKAECKEKLIESLLDFKWQTGKDISDARVHQDKLTFRELEKKTKINLSELIRCVQFFNKYPDGKYPHISWRETMKALPEQKEEMPALPQGEFDVIYADPPWEYEFSKSPRGDPKRHYKTMSTEDIAKLAIPTSKNAILFMWATNPKLEDGLRVMKAWGFEYRTNIVWVKDKFGTGYYVRGQHELLFIGRKGEIGLPLEEDRPSSVLNAPRREHSRKPEEVYALIEKMYPDRKYLELFARRVRSNWVSWGSEVGEI